MIDLSIVIVNFNTPELTINTIQSIFNSNLADLKVQIVLIDNASTDNSVEIFKKTLVNPENIKLEIISNSENSGFGRANNKGIRKATGKYILLLNSDVILKPDTLAKQYQFMEKHSGYDISTCKLVLTSGSIDPACHRGEPTLWASLSYFAKLEGIFPKIRLFSQYHQGWKDLNTTHEVDVISGAFFWARKEVFEKVGLFDEGFFMYAEDVDLCLRIKEKGMKIVFYPKTMATHLKGQSGRKKQTKIKSKTEYYFWQTMKLFYKKHYEKKYPKFVMVLVNKVLDWKMKQSINL